MLTKKKLERFVGIRNRSGFTSNLQFEIDADEAGFRIKDLGPVVKLGEAHYRWDTPHGRLEEVNGVLELTQ